LASKISYRAGSNKQFKRQHVKTNSKELFKRTQHPEGGWCSLQLNTIKCFILNLEQQDLSTTLDDFVWFPVNIIMLFTKTDKQISTITVSYFLPEFPNASIGL